MLPIYLTVSMKRSKKSSQILTIAAIFISTWRLRINLEANQLSLKRKKNHLTIYNKKELNVMHHFYVGPMAKFQQTFIGHKYFRAKKKKKISWLL